MVSFPMTTLPLSAVVPLAGTLAWHVLVVVALYYVVLGLYTVFIYPYYVSPLRHLPGPKDHHFLLGQHLNQFHTGNPEEPYTAWMRRWPKAPLIRYFEFGHADAVLLNDLAVYRDVMQTHCYSFVRTPSFRRLIGDIIGVGLVFSEGHEHRAQRKALGGLFTVSNVKSYLPVFQEKADRLVRDIEAACRDNKGLIEKIFSKITLDVVGLFALGIDLNNFEPVIDPVTGARHRSEFLEVYGTMFDLSTWGMALAAVNLLLPIRWVPLAENRSFLYASKRLRQMLTEITEARIATVKRERDGVTGETGTGETGETHETHETTRNRFLEKDLLTYMVEEKYLAKEGQEHWTKTDMVEQILNFMATGHETTASALTWAMHTLARHPAVVDRLRAEAAALRAACGRDQLTFAEIEGLVYLDHVFREVVRLHCPVAGIPRLAIEDVVVGGQPIKKGTTLMPIPAVIQRNPALWGADADAFNPDRWARDANCPAADNPYAWVAFGHGPRACIGKALASLNFKIVLLALVQRFAFAPDGKSPQIAMVNPSGQIRPKGGVWVRAMPVDAV